MFNPYEPEIAKGVGVELPHPSYTRLIIKAASEGLESVSQSGLAFSKVELMLLDLRQPGELSGGLVEVTQHERSGEVMQAMDCINALSEKGTVRSAIAPAEPI